MRVGFLITGDIRRLSGGYLYDRELIAFLRRRGVMVDLLSLPALPAWADILGNLWFLAKLARRRYDVVMIDGMIYRSVVIIAPWLRHRFRVVSIVHLVDFIMRKGLGRLVGLALEGLVFRLSHLSLANSQYTAGLLKSMRVEKIKVVYPGHRAPKMLGRNRDGGPIRILYVGQYVKRKGLHDLLRALSQIKELNWVLDAAGDDGVDPSYTRMIRRMVDELGLSRRVRLLGRVSDELLERLYAESDVFVLPTHYEAFGIAVAEALANGLPVISYRVGGVAELVEDGVNGFLVRLGDVAGLSSAIAKLIEDGELRRRFSIDARKSIARFPSWDEACSQILSALESLLGRRVAL